jgi:hypothetical protein
MPELVHEFKTRFVAEGSLRPGEAGIGVDYRVYRVT